MDRLQIKHRLLDMDLSLEAMAKEDHRYIPSDKIISVVFYEDAINGDIVIEEIDDETEALLRDVESGRSGVVRNELIVELAKKGLLVLK